MQPDRTAIAFSFDRRAIAIAIAADCKIDLGSIIIATATGGLFLLDGGHGCLGRSGTRSTFGC